MTTNRSQIGSFIVVNLDRASKDAAEIESILEPLGISLEVVESGRQMRFNTAVVLRVPEQRVADVMLALEMKGFADVMAYESNEQGREESNGGGGDGARQ